MVAKLGITNYFNHHIVKWQGINTAQDLKKAQKKTVVLTFYEVDTVTQKVKKKKKNFFDVVYLVP